MILSIIGIIIGLMVAAFSVYLIIKNKSDSESKKIYTITAIIGVAILAVCVIKLVLAL
ncbi:MAG: hypothetical protein Q4D20_06910 [Clostridia bacterium]|nr:hypothetical protein [Clostridia bacterium]